jgi:serine/threonine protein kinase/Tfp pilus assembly protein PilF
MDPKLVKSIFLRAVEQVPPHDWPSYLGAACGDDASLRHGVELLLAAHRENVDLADQARQACHEALPTINLSSAELPGTQIGPYKLIEQIGEGGMGTVWMAQQTEPVRRVVALKLIKAGMDSRQVIARFEAERQALALMDHPNIARVLDAGTTDAGRPYFVMDLVKGLPITRYCDEHHLTPRERLELFIPVCQAVQHAHQKGIIHRDLKPSNVLVALYDGKPVSKVIDFGVAKAAGQSLTDKTLVTGFGNIVGTLEYMSPEQAEVNQLDIDTRSDIYSLGVLLYELLAGSPPFTRKELERAGVLEMLRVIREEEPSKPSTKLSTSDALPTLSANRGTEPAKLTKLVRGELDWIVMKALEKDRNRRYETANGFAIDVQRFLNDEPVQACPPSMAYRLRKFTRRNKRALVAACVLFVALLIVVGTVGWSIRDRSARHARVASQVELILEEVDRLEQEQKWDEALDVARRAEAALASDVAEASTREHVHLVLADLEMVADLERIRLGRSDGTNGGTRFDNASTARRYGAAFREYGVEVESLRAEQAAEQLRSHPAILVPLVAALDDWSQRSKFSDDGLEENLETLVGIIDTDSWRRRVRAAVTARDNANLIALADDPETARQPPQSQIMLSWGLQRAGQITKAISLLEQASEAHPNDFWIHFQLGTFNHFYLRPPRLEVAVRHFSIARALRPRSGVAWANLGCALHEQKKLDLASSCFKQAIELDPQNEIAHNNLGNVLRDQKKLDEAIASLKRAIELDPKYATPHINVGNVWYDRQKFEQAIGSYQHALKIDPQHAGAHAGLGQALRSQKKLDEAIASFQKAIELLPDYAPAHAGLGGVFHEQKKFDEAAAAYRKAIKLAPLHGAAHNNLGLVLRAQNKLDEAIASHRRAVALDPHLASAQSNLGHALAAQSKWVEAMSCFRKAIELDPQ